LLFSTVVFAFLYFRQKSLGGEQRWFLQQLGL
jgi:hypothetical protein